MQAASTFHPSDAVFKRAGHRIDAGALRRSLAASLPVVIDHGAKPFVTRGLLDPWRDDIAALAARGVDAKLSGLRTEQEPGAAAKALRPYVDHLLACFGERLMWGSDWPVLLLSGDDYGQWFRDADRLTALKGDARQRLFAGVARHFYRLEFD